MHNGIGLKLKDKFQELYKFSNLKPHDHYDPKKIGYHDDPNKTSSAAGYISYRDMFLFNVYTFICLNLRLNFYKK